MSSFEKQRNILDFTLSSLSRRKGKNIALVTIYAAVIGLVASVLFFADAIRKEAALILRMSPEIIVQRLSAGRYEPIPRAFADSLKEVRGVHSVKPRLWGYYYDQLKGANFTVIASDDPVLESGACSLGSGVAKTMNTIKDGIIPLKTYKGPHVFLKIKSAFSAESDLVTADLILVSAEDFRKIFNLPEDYATDLVLTVKNAKELPTIAAKIIELFPDARPILRDEILRTYQALFNWRGGMVVVVLFGAIFSFIVLAWDKATGLSAEEKHEIGILKAVGWETSDVLRMKFWEGAVVSLFSFFLGVLLAYIHIFFCEASIFAPVLKGWAVLYPEFMLTPFIDFRQLTALFLLTVAPYTIATIIPTWRAATIDPDTIDEVLTTVIELSNIRKVFNAGKSNEFVAVDKVNLVIDSHRVTGFRGPSGSGKTTLLSLFGCMARPTSGRIFLSGEEITSLPERFLTEIRRRDFGFIFQQFNLIKGLTALENVMIPAYPTGEKHGQIKSRALELLDLLNLAPKAESKVEWLSGGEAQRVAIARALINGPSIIVADEPTAHLDSRLSAEFMDIIRILKEQGKTVVVASHDPIVFRSNVVDRLVDMRDGQVVALEPTE